MAISKTEMLQILKKEIAEYKIVLKHLLKNFYLGHQINRTNEIIQKSHNKNFNIIPDSIGIDNIPILNLYYEKLVEQLKYNYACINKIHRYCKDIK